MSAGTDRAAGLRRAVLAIAVVGGAGVVLMLSGVLPSRWLTLGTLVGINALAALGLSVLVGQAGLISFAQATFMGFGAYTVAIMLARFALPPELTLVLAFAVPTVIAYLVSIPLLRLSGLYLGFGTLALVIIGESLFTNLIDLTGGPTGMTGIPDLRIAGFVFETRASFFVLTWALVALVVVLLENVARSRPGYALRSVRGSEQAAMLIGVPVLHYQRQAFMVSAGVGGLAGSLYAHFTGFVSPDTFGLVPSVALLIMVAIGGSRRVWAAIPGAVIVGLVNLAIAQLTNVLGTQVVPVVQAIVYGGLILLITVYAPTGALPTIIRAVAGRGPGTPERPDVPVPTAAAWAAEGTGRGGG